LTSDPDDVQPLGVGLGEEYLHLLYQEYREDVSGVKRVGLMYTHGFVHDAVVEFPILGG
jgi:hypothetical protein